MAIEERNYWANVQTRFPRRTLLRGATLGGVGLAGAALLGCGADDDEETPPGVATPTDDAADDDAPAPDPDDPRYGGVLRFGSGSAIAHFDPHQSVTPASQTQLWHLIGNQLVRMHSERLLVEGDLAKEWETPDPTTYVFHLDENARWNADSEAGISERAITAEDIAYSFMRTKTDEPTYARRSQYDNVTSFDVVDDHTLRIVLDEPSVPFLAVVGDIYETVVAPEVVERHGDLRLMESAHGGGPFVVDKRTFDKEIGGRFERNPNYFKKDEAGRDLPYLDGIEWQFIGDAAGLYAALQAGQTDIGGLSPENEEDFRRGNPDWEFIEQTGLSRDCYLMQVERDPFTDVRVRQAVSWSIDRNLMRDIGRGRGELSPAVSPAMEHWVLPWDELITYPGYRAPEDEAGREADRAEAKKLLDAAGYDDGLTLDIFTTSAYNYVLIAESGNPQLEQYLGLRFNIRMQEWGVLKEHEAQGTYTIAATNYYSGPEPDLHLHLYHHTTGGRNYSRLSDPDVDRILEQQRVEFDEEARRELIFEAQRMLLDLSAPAWLISPAGVGVRAPYVKNYGARPIAAGWDNETVWMDA